MKKSHILLALASASLIAGGQAIAQGRGGGHGGGHGQGNAGAMGSGMGRGGADTRLDRELSRSRGEDVRSERRARSRGPAHASDRAIERANENSVLNGTVRSTTNLSALRTGLSVRNASGMTLGTIRRINRSSDGTVRSVLVDSATGQRTIPVRPGTLTIAGDVVTTTQLRPPRN